MKTLMITAAIVAGVAVGAPAMASIGNRLACGPVYRSDTGYWLSCWAVAESW
jgi:hypothetical protein